MDYLIKNLEINDFDVFFLTGSTPFGEIIIIWIYIINRPKILRIILTKPQLSAKDQLYSWYPQAMTESCLKIDNIARDMQSFLQGVDMVFSLDDVLMDQCTSFQREVLKAEYRISRGMVSTYQRIAKHLKKPGGARAVGNALANNPFPLIIPCHRVICSDGFLGGYQGGLNMKKSLLKMEGIKFNQIARIVNKRYFY